MEKKTIRPLRGALTNDDYYALGTLLLKAGYAVQLTSVTVPGKSSKERVIQYWEEGTKK